MNGVNNNYDNHTNPLVHKCTFVYLMSYLQSKHENVERFLAGIIIAKQKKKPPTSFMTISTSRQNSGLSPVIRYITILPGL